MLTESAIFLLLRDYDAVHSDIFKSLLRNYPDSIIFEIFLYPFFAKDTLFRIYGKYHTDVLLKYLHDCCDELAKYQLSIQRTKAFGGFLFKWGGLNKNEIRRINEPPYLPLRDFLKHELSLKWSDNAEIMLTEDVNKVRISHGLDSLQICLSQNKEEADLIIKGERIITLKISSYTNSEGTIVPWCVHKQAEAFEEIELEFLLGRIRTLIFVMVTNMYDKALILDQAFVKEDMELLCKDNKFVETIDDFKSIKESRARQYV